MKVQKLEGYVHINYLYSFGWHVSEIPARYLDWIVQRAKQSMEFRVNSFFSSYFSYCLNESMQKERQCTPAFLLENLMDRGALAGYSSWDQSWT